VFGSKFHAIHLPNVPLPLLYLLEFFIQLLFFLFMLFGIHLNGNEIKDLLGPWPRDSVKLSSAAFWGLCTGCLSIGIAFCIYLLLGRFYRGSEPGIAPRNLAELLLFFATSLTSGFWEEFTFRGYLLRQIYFFNRNLALAVLLQAAFFTLAHGPNQTFAGVTDKMIFSVLMAWITIRCKSLLPAIIAHAFGNAILGLLAFSAR